MICYPENVNELEILAINDYWLLTEKSPVYFRYTVKEINDFYKKKGVRSVNLLAKHSRFVSTHPSFACTKCDRKKPIFSRTSYNIRVKIDTPFPCEECTNEENQTIIEKANKKLKEYRNKTFYPSDYLKTLTKNEILALLSIITEQSDDTMFLGKNLDEILITGVKQIDKQITQLLVEKKAIIFLAEIPIEVDDANEELFGISGRLRFKDWHKDTLVDRHPASITRGVYLNSPACNPISSKQKIIKVLYEKLGTSSVSINDIQQTQRIVTEIQTQKIYMLAFEAAKEYNITVSNSSSFRALVSHLSENYGPRSIYLVFRFKAKATAASIHSSNFTHSKNKHLFTKYVERHIQYIEIKGAKLEQAWWFPINISTSPFESIFSDLYISNHLDWNMLSIDEVISTWANKEQITGDITPKKDMYNES